MANKITRISFDPIGGASSAASVSYDNTSSGLTATNVQDAIDETVVLAETAQSDIDNHIADATDAHDASAISNAPSGTISSTTVQAAINELDSDVQAVSADVADLVTLSGVPANSTTLGTFTGSIIPNSSDIKDALQSLETAIEEIPDPFFYAGTWNASTNSPDLDLVGARVIGATYYVTTAGTHNFGVFGGSITFNVGDKAVFNGTVWDKWDVVDEPKYTQSFNSTTDWTLNVDVYEITVLASSHGFGTSPSINVFELDTAIYYAVQCVIKINASGNVTIQVSGIPDNRFEGKIVIN